MLVRTEGFYAGEGGAPAPGAQPAFGAMGASVSSTNVAGTHAITYPATVGVGDLIVAVSFAFVAGTGALTGLSMHADLVSAGFTEITGSPFKKTGVGADDYWMLIATKDAVGDEDGATITNGITGTTTSPTSDGILTLMFNLTAADGFADPPFDFIGTPTECFNVETINAPTVTPSGINRLGLSILGLSNDPTGLAAWAGATPDTWAVAELRQVTTTGGITIQVQEIDLSAGDPVSGGSETWSGNSTGFAVPLSVAPADV